MKKVKVRHESDCVAACLAAVFEQPIDEMPDFWQSRGGLRQYNAVSRWLKERGYHWLYSSLSARQFAGFQKGRPASDDSFPPKGYWFGHIARVETIVQDDTKHMVVMKGNKCVFNPDSTIKATKDDDVFLVGYYILVPFDPIK